MRWRLAVSLVAVVAGCPAKQDGDRRPPEAKPPIAVAPTPTEPACTSPGGRTCVDRSVVACQANGALGEVIERCDATCYAGACVDTCAVKDVELVYVVGSDRGLRSFDPRKLPRDPFSMIAELTCDLRSRPFSMAVDRKGIAWINYDSGDLHRVSVLDGKCLGVRQPEGSPTEFGMGFVTDGPDAETERLYVAPHNAGTLAELDVSVDRPRWKPIGTLGRTINPELTGTGGGELFGFFPQGGVAPFVSQIDRASGELVGPRRSLGSERGLLRAWAFAHWGGKFYVFITIDGNSMVFVVDPKANASTLLLQHLPYRIVGAGVSTCAPLLESPPA